MDPLANFQLKLPNGLLDPNVTPDADPGRPKYVLLHRDKSHCYCVDGQSTVHWSHEPKDLELTKKILKEDFNTTAYEVVDLKFAIVAIGEVQAVLVEIWTPYINRIRKTGSVEKRWEIYANAKSTLKQPHPVEADKLLRRLLQLPQV